MLLLSTGLAATHSALKPCHPLATHSWIAVSYKAVATAMKAPSGPAVEAWSRNGVAYKWRPELDRKFGAAFRKSLNDLVV